MNEGSCNGKSMAFEVRWTWIQILFRGTYLISLSLSFLTYEMEEIGRQNFDTYTNIQKQQI